GRALAHRGADSMCSRYTLTTPAREVTVAFGLETVPDLPARYNIAPTQPVAVVRLGQAGRGLALGAGAAVGRRPACRRPPDQRPGRDSSQQASLPLCLGAWGECGVSEQLEAERIGPALAIEQHPGDGDRPHPKLAEHVRFVGVAVQI